MARWRTGFSSRHRCWGSVALRNHVATRFNDSAHSMIATPGKVTIHQACWRYSRPLAIMSPQDGFGGWIPKPRKLSDASERIRKATSSVPSTSSGDAKLGNRCRNITRRLRAPTAVAARTNSASR